MRAAQRAPEHARKERARYSEAVREMVRSDEAAAKVGIELVTLEKERAAAFHAGTATQWGGWSALREAREREAQADAASDARLKSTLDANKSAGEAGIEALAAADVALDALLERSGAGGKSAARAKAEQARATRKLVDRAHARGTSQREAAKQLRLSRTIVQKYWPTK